MARIRTIKPEFWTSEQVVACCRDARLLFVGLLNFCDDNGIHPASVKRLKMEVFPADSVTDDQIAQWIGELIENGLLNEYEAENRNWWIVRKWHEHQRIDKPTYKHPLPPGSKLKPPNKSFADDSANSRRMVAEQSTTEGNGNGMERSGQDWNGVTDLKEILSFEEPELETVFQRAKRISEKLSIKSKQDWQELLKCCLLIEAGKLSENELSDAVNAALNRTDGPPMKAWPYARRTLANKIKQDRTLNALLKRIEIPDSFLDPPK